MTTQGFFLNVCVVFVFVWDSGPAPPKECSRVLLATQVLVGLTAKGGEITRKKEGRQERKGQLFQATDLRGILDHRHFGFSETITQERHTQTHRHHQIHRATHRKKHTHRAHSLDNDTGEAPSLPTAGQQKTTPQIAFLRRYA